MISATFSACRGSEVRMELAGVAIGQLLRGHPLALGGVLDRLAVLVGPGQEEDVAAALAHVAGEDVGRHRRVRVPEVGLGIDVVDRGGDVVGVVLAHVSGPSLARSGCSDIVGG
jgi:hypothetical protein